MNRNIKIAFIAVILFSVLPFASIGFKCFNIFDKLINDSITSSYALGKKANEIELLKGQCEREGLVNTYRNLSSADAKISEGFEEIKQGFVIWLCVIPLVFIFNSHILWRVYFWVRKNT